jgi:uncharacterized protein YhhL (DUF1145 family)
VFQALADETRRQILDFLRSGPRTSGEIADQAIDRVRTGNGAFESTYHAIVLRTTLFVVALHTLVMLDLTRALADVGLQPSAGRVVVVLFGILLLAVGNLLPRTRPNVAVGVRTARTLANVQLWQRVHRAGGYVTAGRPPASHRHDDRRRHGVGVVRSAVRGHRAGRNPCGARGDRRRRMVA